MALTCSNCGHANREAARFCSGCGQEMFVRCSTCGAAIPASERYCDACGASVDGRDAIVEGARKVVTVLFADLVGSTSWQETLDPESAQRVMSRFFDAMRAVIEAHGGEVEKFIGDAVAAVFGLPRVGEDDAIRAVRAAVAMVAALVDLNQELEQDWGVRLRMRVGINTGELVVTDEGILVGDTMNTAARLQQVAPEGEVLVGRATWQLVHHAVKLEPVTPLELKGKGEPVDAWRLSSAAPADAAASEAVLVGRENELARLESAYADALAARACRFVSVIGPPGVGKTRLAREFGPRLGDRARLVVGRCESAVEGDTFLPIAQVFSAIAGIGESDDPETVREKLGRQAPTDHPEADVFVERVAGVLGTAEPAPAQEIFWAVRRGLEQFASEQPLVLVLDDLHGAQPMLFDLVEHLIEWVQDAPILIIALARPELRERRDALSIVGRRVFDVIELGPLNQAGSRELIGSLFGDLELPPALSAQILETTEGNPLFLSETLRMLVDDGVLRREGQSWVAVNAAAGINVPPTINALLTARIERLRQAERAVIERAAVIGKHFYRGAVAQLVAPPVAAAIDEHLSGLRRKDMVEPAGSYWIDEPVFRFHHILIRDAAYRLVLKEARAELHERFAAWLELKAPELVGEHEEVIAFHLEQAHEYRRQLGPLDERGRALGARAAERLHSAGRRALARADLDAASNLLGRALEREADDDGEIVWDLAEAVLSAGDAAAVRPLIDRLAGGAARDPRGPARAAILEAQVENLTGSEHVEATIRSIDVAADSLRELGDRVGEAKARHVAAQAHARLGQVGAAEQALDQAHAIARDAGDTRRVTAVLAAVPRAALWGPSPVVRASGRCHDVARVVRMASGNRHVEAIALRCQAVLEAMRGRDEAAREILTAARSALEELGLTLELHETAVHAGIVELLAGDPVTAASHLRAAQEGFSELHVDSGTAQAAAILARALLEQGGNEAEAILLTELAEQRGGEDLKTTITWCGVRAEALARVGEFERALPYARRAVALAEPTDALADKADAMLALAAVLRAGGRESEAVEAARAAGSLYATKGHQVGAESALRLAGDAPDSGDARPATRSVRRLAFRDRPPWRYHAEIKRRFDAQQLDELLELYDPDYVMVEHRALGWDELHGREPLRAVFESAFAMAPDLRLDVDEVLACDDRVIALRITYRGHASDGAGDLELSLGYVSVFEGGLWCRDEQYEYEDDAAMLARYGELGGQGS